MTIVHSISANLDTAEVSRFAALCADDCQFLSVPDGPETPLGAGVRR